MLFMFFGATQQQDHVKLFGWSKLKYLLEEKSVLYLCQHYPDYLIFREREGRAEKSRDPEVYMHCVEGF